MKKKLLLIIGMFLFITNVNALTFEINITNIEDKGNNGTIGSIERIDVANKELDIFMQDIGDEVNFAVTVTNTGDRAGTLREITFEPGNDKMEYTSNLPEGGLAINGNDTNVIIITAKVKEGAVNGTFTSNVKLKYTYDEGSCPEGETLSPDESMCLCPEGMERSEQGTCVTPVKPTDCKDDEVYNAQKKKCEKKVVPPNNPKTLDNIVLVTLLFIVSGLGIYSAMFKKLKTKEKKIKVGVVTGVITLTLSFVTLASVFGIDKLLSAVINPITKHTELAITINEEIELIETWDGECSLDVASLTPQNIFQGGSGTQADPYQIKTAEQLSCFAKSVNNGNNYEGKYIKQIKNIKLNDKLLDNITNNTTNNLNTWIPIGSTTTTTPYTIINSFNGTYDGDNHVISGVYIDSQSSSNVGFFNAISGATIKNLTLSDNYVKGDQYVGLLVGYSDVGSLIKNVKTYGKVAGTKYVAGIVSTGTSTTPANQNRILNSENHADVTAYSYSSGIAYSFYNIINTKNYGIVTATENASGIAGYSNYIINCENHGDVIAESYAGGLTTAPSYAFNSDNYGNIYGRYIDGTSQNPSTYAGLVTSTAQAYDCNNYGDIDATYGSLPVGVVSSGAKAYKSGSTGTITMHDYNASTASVYITGIYASGSSEISDAELSSNSCVQTYRDIMGKNFAAENEYTYNDGDIYVNNVTVGSLNVSAIGNSGSSPIINAHNTGSIYISNSSANGGYITMIGADGVQTTNSVSEGDIIIDNYTIKDFELAGVGISGSSSTNARYEGTIEVKNSTIGDSAYPTGNGAQIAGGTTAGAYIVNSYIKGDIKIHDNTFVSGAQVGGLSASGAGGETSYSEKEIEIYNNTGTEFRTATLATNGGRGITNCYNRGNINIHDNSFNSIVNDNYASTVVITGGGNSGPFFGNYYNLGNLTFETANNTRLTSLEVDGINSISHVGNSNIVNTGNITVPYVSTVTNLTVGGLFGTHIAGTASNAYNSGTIAIGDGYTYSEDINYGNLYAKKAADFDPTGLTPSAYYTQEGYAMGLSRLGSQYSQYEGNYGAKINASQVPDILSIINVNDKFEIKQGETLPTLKVFNQ